MRFAEDAVEKLVYSDGVARQIHIWQPDDVEVVLLAIHGGLAHGGDWLNVGTYFKEYNYATIAPDLHGHDKQKRVYIPSFDVFLADMDLYVSWAKARYPGKPLFLLGHSMGALILTHYGLRRLTEPTELVKGFIISSPYFVNAIKVPALLESLSGLLAAVAPRLKIPVEDFTDYLTHDEAITKRHKGDAADDLRATEVSARFGRELLLAQNYIPENIGRWAHPLLTFIAGQDKLADSQATQRLIGQIDASLTTTYHYPDNFHENFNEINRATLFAIMHDWIRQRL